MRKTPDDPVYTYEHAITLKQAGDLGEAKRLLDRAVELDPGVGPAQHGLGVVELLTGNAVKAIEPLEKAVALEPANGSFHFTLAQAYERVERVDESLASYEAYLRYADDDDPQARLVRDLLLTAKRVVDEPQQQRASR